MNNTNLRPISYFTSGTTPPTGDRQKYIRGRKQGWSCLIHSDISPIPSVIFTAGEKLRSLASSIIDFRRHGFETKRRIWNLKRARGLAYVLPKFDVDAPPNSDR